MQNILLVEDDLLLSQNISSLLEKEMYNVTVAGSLSEINHNPQDLIILDWRLPDGRGIDFLKSLRANFNSTPVIMLTSKSEVEDKVIGLELGANDYMTKVISSRFPAAEVVNYENGARK